MNKEKQEKVKKFLPYAAAGLVAGGVFKHYRTPKNLGTSLQKAYQDGGDALTIGYSYGAKSSRKTGGKAFYSADLNFKKINEKGISRSPGVFFNKNIVDDSKEVADAVINDSKTSKELLQQISGKDSLRDLPGIGNYFPKSQRLDDALRAQSFDVDNIKNWSKSEFDNAFSKLEQVHGPQFLKPIHGQSMGKGTSQIYADLNTATSAKKVKPSGIKKYFTEHAYENNPKALPELRNNVDNYIISDNLGKNKEVRIHTLNGKVVDTVRRFGALEGVQTGVKLPDSLKAKFEADLQLMYKQKGLEGRNISLAFDGYVDKSSKDPRIKLIEANPNSGFLFDLNPVNSAKGWADQRGYWSSHRMYEAITGKKTTMASGIRAGIAGGATLVGGKAISERKK